MGRLGSAGWSWAFSARFAVEASQIWAPLARGICSIALALVSLCCWGVCRDKVLPCAHPTPCALLSGRRECEGLWGTLCRGADGSTFGS